jgi:hypothetical protein
VAHFGTTRHKVAQVLAGSPNEPETASHAHSQQQPPDTAPGQQEFGKCSGSIVYQPKPQRQAGIPNSCCLLAGCLVSAAVAVGAGGCCVLSLCRLVSLSLKNAAACVAVNGKNLGNSADANTACQPNKAQAHADTPVQEQPKGPNQYSKKIEAPTKKTKTAQKNQNGTKWPKPAQKNQNGTKWPNSAHFGPNRHKVAQLGTFWPKPAQSGPTRHKVAQLGTFWPKPAQKSTKRHKVAHFGTK